MEKLDLAKTHKAYYTAKATPELVDIGPAAYLSIAGQGDPSGQTYATRVGALYGVAYTLKFMYKAKQKDFTVAKLEGMWWFDEDRFGRPSMEEAPVKVPRSEWQWRMLIRLPDFVTPKALDDAIDAAFQKKKTDAMRDVVWHEEKKQKVVQMLHTGPFSEEPATLKKMLAFIEEHQLKKAGLHREVYLSNYKTTASAKLRTILREPVETTDPI
ncbi:GyrI-like domain-containing protein [Chryseolinea lacunae]|uniref:GyrI-like domain-containing protein n=1 Tax=Chryseolinea lacunae TaxID=2801331 RepID=A0ABS1L0V0_9BACT|nr:GyrI-like domain-containing protein [Chryseolinea lacunae]MBL0745137.1 GyrI-like domain-containing protein [Chryseolinea lacunae]